MSGHQKLTDIRFVAASDDLRARGLLYFGEATYGALRISLTVRRTRAGHLALSFPVRHDSRGRQHQLVRPVDGVARRAIEAQVFVALGIKTEERAP